MINVKGMEGEFICLISLHLLRILMDDRETISSLPSALDPRAARPMQGKGRKKREREREKERKKKKLKGGGLPPPGCCCSMKTLKKIAAMNVHVHVCMNVCMYVCTVPVSIHPL